MKLTATGVKQAKPREKPFKLSDGGGLFLLVNPAGSKYWRYKYRYLGKEKTLALGVFPEVSLKHARQKHQEAREKLANGIDPAELRKVEKLTRTFSASNTFESVGREWFAVRMGGKSKSHYDRTLRILEKDLFPKLGSRPLESIKAPEILVVLRGIQERGATDTAHRARSVASQVFCFAEAAGLVDHDPTRALRNALKPHEKKHYAAITDPAEVRRLLLAMDCYSGTITVRCALQLSVLIFQRPGLIRSIEWSQIDWDKRQLVIDETVMQKTFRHHIVPLSDQAISLLKSMQPVSSHRSIYVFPGARSAKRPLSDNAIRSALRSMGFDGDTMTPHGFRAMGRTILDEVLGYRPDWIEHHLAHMVKDPTGRAYNRTTHLEGRTEMMQVWADYLDLLRNTDLTIKQVNQMARKSAHDLRNI